MMNCPKCNTTREPDDLECKKITQFVISALFIFIFINPVKAEIYQWTDGNGNVHYTNTVPPKVANSVASSKEIVEPSGSKSTRLEQERKDAELQKKEKEYRALKKQKRDETRRLQAQIDRLKGTIKGQNKEKKLSGEGIYLHREDVVCRTGYDVYSYYYHKYNNNPLNLEDIFADGLCWKLKGTKDVIWISNKIEDHPYGKSVKIQYWHKGDKVTAYTHPKNVK